MAVLRESLVFKRVFGLVAIITVCVAAAGIAAGDEPFMCEGVQVIDGDTVRVKTLHLAWGVSLTDVTIRAADYDAWESSRIRRTVPVDDAEIVKGKAAAAELRRLLERHRLEVRPVGEERDTYGRLLGAWYLRDPQAPDAPAMPVVEVMKIKGHTRR